MWFPKFGAGVFTWNKILEYCKYKPITYKRLQFMSKKVAQYLKLNNLKNTIKLPQTILLII